MKDLARFTAILLLTASCGAPRTSGFFSGPLIGRTTTGSEQPLIPGEPPGVSDTLLNSTFDNVMDAPFGNNCPHPVYGGAMHIDNHAFDEPVLLMSTAALQKDGLVEASFDIVESRSHSVAGLVLRAEDEESFLLAGANSRGQYTIQRCMRGLWIPVMGLDPFESSRLLPFDPDRMVLSAEVHGTYVDFYVNGQLIQVVKTSLPVMGQVGVFVDGRMSVDLDRFTVVPFE